MSEILLLIGKIVVLSWCISYLTIIFMMRLGWRKLKLHSIPAQKSKLKSISVLVIVRNEREHIISFLEEVLAIDYPREKFELIIIDDHSDDETFDLASDFIKSEGTGSFYIYKSPPEIASKKDSFLFGIEKANNGLIFKTDADCKIPKRILHQYSSYFNSPDVVMCCGFVFYEKHKGLLPQVFRIEHISLQSTTAGFFGIKHPIIASGANIGFRTEWAKQLMYHNHDTLRKNFLSGDDMFLLHAAKKSHREQIQFVLSSENNVLTKPPANMAAFFAQRARWSSKTRAVKDPLTFWTALIVFSYAVLLIMFLLLGFRFHELWVFALLLAGIKVFADYFALFPVFHFLKERFPVFIVFFMQLFYPIYIIVAALLGILGLYQWKNRKGSGLG